VIRIKIGASDKLFPTATRVSTDEHNNLEIWSGDDGEDLLWLCAAERWSEVEVIPNADEI
jgi:hypothetical protein